jgi:hypothetical protein
MIVLFENFINSERSRKKALCFSIMIFSFFTFKMFSTINKRLYSTSFLNFNYLMNCYKNNKEKIYLNNIFDYKF